MNRPLLLTKLLSAVLFLFFSCLVQAQSSLSSPTLSGSSTISGTGPLGVTFTLENTNSYPVILTDMAVNRGTNSSGVTYNLFYNATSLSGSSNINTTPGWTLITSTSASAVSATGIAPTFSGMNFTIPAYTMYRFAVTAASGTLYMSGSSTATSNTSAGLILGEGAYQVNAANVGYAGGSGNFTATPRYYGLNITFNSAPLAIKLEGISATNFGASNRLSWKTLMEDASDSYVIERSTDGNNFMTLSAIEANGTPSEYTYWDEAPVVGINHYRLKVLSAGGNPTYSRVVSATVKTTGVITVTAFPNPVSNTLSIRSNNAAHADIMLIDMMGRIVKMTSTNNGNAEVDMSHIQAGSYLLKYSAGLESRMVWINKR